MANPLNTGINPSPINPMPPGMLGKTAGATQFSAANAVDQGQITELEKQRQAAFDKYSQGIGQAQGEHAAGEAEASKSMKALVGAEPPPPPDFQAMHKDAHELTGMMLVLSALSGAVTRAPLTASMNNFSAAIKGMAEGRQQEAEEQYKQYEANLKKADVLHKRWQDQFNAIKEDIKEGSDSYRDKIAAMKTEFEFNDKQITQGISDAKDHVKMLIDMGNSANNAYEKMMNSVEKMREHKETVAERHQHNQEMIALMKERIEKGGEGKPAVRQFTGKDGKTYTQSVYRDGRIAVHNPSGEEVDANISGYAQPKGGSKNADVRAHQVKSSVNNALRSLNEVQQKHGESAKGSIYYGTESSTPVGNLLHGAGKSVMSPEQQQTDASLMSAAEETAFALTGGMRASDSFRRFVQNQFPRFGDSDEAAREKYLIIRANLDGTSMAWFNKLASDPSNFASKDDYQTFKTEILPLISGGGDASTQPAPQGGIDPSVEAILKKHGV